MRREVLVATAIHGALALGAVVVLLPFLWITIAAFKTQIALLTGVFVFTPTLYNFQEVIASTTSEYLLNFRNSLVVAVASMVIVCTIASLGAFSIRRLNWPRWFPHLILVWAIIFQMIPPITLVGAWFVMFRAVGLDNTYAGLVLAHVTLNLPLALWLMARFIDDVPIELEEAARIDGASKTQLFRYVFVPLLAPSLAATAILVFIFSWNEFAVALNLTQRQTATVPVAIAKFAQEYEIQYTAMAASAVLSLIPALVLLIAGQRYIVKGLTAGAIR
jgi:multiple sugar transport system permease protein